MVKTGQCVLISTIDVFDVVANTNVIVF